MNYQDSMTNSTFHAGTSIATNTGIACTPWKQFIEKAGEPEREDRQKKYEIQKVRLSVRIISNYSKVSDHSNFV